jgi:hypothetical protein
MRQSENFSIASCFIPASGTNVNALELGRIGGKYNHRQQKTKWLIGKQEARLIMSVHIHIIVRTNNTRLHPIYYSIYLLASD